MGTVAACEACEAPSSHQCRALKHPHQLQPNTGTRDSFNSCESRNERGPTTLDIFYYVVRYYHLRVAALPPIFLHQPALPIKFHAVAHVPLPHPLPVLIMLQAFSVPFQLDRMSISWLLQSFGCALRAYTIPPTLSSWNV